MTLPTLIIDTQGDVEVADAQRLSYDSMLNTRIPSATQPYLIAGTGTPTFTAPQGTLYINITGNSVSTRAYINTSGSTVWTAVTTVA